MGSVPLFLPHVTFFVGSAEATALLARLRRRHPTLGEAVNGKIQRGVSPDVVAAHVVSRAKAKKLRLEPGLLEPSVSGTQIKRYEPWKCDQYILYTAKDTQIRRHPRALHYLENFRGDNSCREVAEGKHPWWCLHRPRDPGIFGSPKFIGLTTSKTIEVIYDEQSSAFVTDAMYVFSLIPSLDPMAAMAVLHSKLFLFLYRVANQGESRIIPQVKATKLSALPFPSVCKQMPETSALADASERMLHLHKRLPKARTPQEQESLRRAIDATGRRIDSLVYELYGLTESDIKIVGGYPPNAGERE